jgi:hypothetical protein
MPTIANNNYAILRGLTLTQSGSTPTNKTQTVVNGAVRDRGSATNGSVTAATVSGTTYTYTTGVNHNLAVGDLVHIDGVTGATTSTAYVGTFTVTGVPTATTFTVTGSASPGAATVASNAVFYTDDISIVASGLTASTVTLAAPTSGYKRIDVVV